MPDESAPEVFRPSYTPAVDEPQLSIRSIVAGCLIGAVCSCTNVYMGLKVGWTFGASIIAAVLSFAIFAALGKRLSVLETNTAQTAGSAAGYMSSAAGLVSAIPAMSMLGHEIEWWALVLWGISTAFLGVFFAVPLRRQMIEVENLQFPSGVATAETILAMYSEAGEAIVKAKVLIWSGAFAGLYMLVNHFVPAAQEPPLHEWFPGIPLLGVLAAWGFTVALGPSLVGAGFIMGTRVILSMVLGAVLAWGCLGPLAQHMGWAAGKVMEYKDGPRGWLLWPGVTLMVVEALTSLVLSWKTFVRALTVPRKHTTVELDCLVPYQERIPEIWWIGGLILGSLATMTITQMVFQIPWYLTILAIGLSFILAIVAVRSVGETDTNPVGGMGKVTQLVFGGLAPGSIITNLMCAAITGAGASQAGDMMTDLKTGRMLGASPRKQLIAQLCGVCAGIVFVIPVYMMFIKAYPLDAEKPILSAPAAHAWKAMAELLVNGLDALPEMAEPAIIVAALIGMLLPSLRLAKSIQPYVPSGLAMGIAFIIPAFNSLQMFWGLLIWLAWRAMSPKACDKYTYAVASGLIAGEGLMGIINALLTILKVDSLTSLINLLKFW